MFSALSRVRVLTRPMPRAPPRARAGLVLRTCAPLRSCFLLRALTHAALLLHAALSPQPSTVEENARFIAKPVASATSSIAQAGPRRALGEIAPQNGGGAKAVVRPVRLSFFARARPTPSPHAYTIGAIHMHAYNCAHGRPPARERVDTCFRTHALPRPAKNLPPSFGCRR